LERLIEIQGEDLREWLISDYGWVGSRCMIKALILDPYGCLRARTQTWT
jgi:hypothetical protein